MSRDVDHCSIKPTVVILAGGLATRLKPLTEKFPKALIPIKGKPFLEYQIEILKNQKLTNIVICTGFEGRQIEDHFQDGSAWGVQITYSYDGEILLGTGGALKKALPLLSSAFFVLYGDSYLNASYWPIFNFFIEKQASLPYPNPLGLMTVFKNENRYDRSNIIFKDNTIVMYDKKKSLPEMNYIDWGLGILTAEALMNFGNRAVFDLAEIYQDLVLQKRLLGYEVSTRFHEIGSLEGLREIENIL